MVDSQSRRAGGTPWEVLSPPPELGGQPALARPRSVHGYLEVLMAFVKFTHVLVLLSDVSLSCCFLIWNGY